MATDELTDRTEDDSDLHGPSPVVGERRVEVRRNLWLSAAIAVGAGAMAVLFGLRASAGAAPLDWAACGVLAVISLLHLAATADGRAPLLVADGTGVRLRHGADWEGVAWSEVACLEHLPRRTFRDGHVLVVGRDQEQLVVPLTWATRLAGASRATLSDELAALSGGRADVVEVVPDGAGEDAGADDADSDDLDEADRHDPDHDDEATAEIARLPRPDGASDADPAPGGAPDAGDPGDPAPVGGLDDDVTVDDVATGEIEPIRDEVPARDTGRTGLISSLVHRGSRGVAAPTAGATALQSDPSSTALPEQTMLRRVDADDDGAPDADVEATGDRVRVIHRSGGTTEETLTVVLEDLRVQPATEPVVGPPLRAAREQLRLTIDQLAERTRIRPHVIEAIEEDDFAPCGGDFYARGHLRTLARVLGIDSAPLVTTYDERYADAPVDPRRVFESELATGRGGAIRGTRGGRNWSVLVAAVMAAVLVWSVARLVMDGPAPIGDAPVLNQSGGIGGAAAKAETVPVTLTAPGGGAKVVVRDGGGGIVFDGDLAFGQTMELDVEPPVRISSSDGSVTASLEGADARQLGETGEDASKVLVP